MDETPTGAGGSAIGRGVLSVAGFLVAAVGLTYFLNRQGDQRDESPAALGTDVATDPAGQPSPDAPAADPGSASGSATELVAGPATGDAPSVDVMRVEPGGAAIVAGRARPGASVAVLSGDRRVAEVQADETGRFVAMFDAGTSDAPRALTVVASSPDGTTTRSDQVVVILPNAAAPDGDEAGEVALAGTAGIAAAAVLSPDKAEVIPLSRPTGARRGQVAFASISYGDAGAVALDGFGLPGAGIRVYVDGELMAEGEVDTDGRWAITVPGSAPGTYTIRVDQIDEAGNVLSRTETPFRRDTGGGAPPRPGEVSIVVQPGNNLWTLARIHYGSGMRYTQLFDANTRLISNPDLIYPGQIFHVPDRVGAAEGDAGVEGRSGLAPRGTDGISAAGRSGERREPE